MDLEQALTSRDDINAALRGVLDEATGKWGVRVNRVELKAIDPPPSIKDSMEKQMRAERDKRATILTAEGFKQSPDPHRGGREAVGDPAGRGRRARRRSCAPTARPRRSTRCSRRSTRATPTPSCWPTSTSSRCPQIAQGACEQDLGHPGRAVARRWRCSRRRSAGSVDAVRRQPASPAAGDRSRGRRPTAGSGRRAREPRVGGYFERRIWRRRRSTICTYQSAWL